MMTMVVVIFVGMVCLLSHCEDGNGDGGVTMTMILVLLFLGIYDTGDEK